MQMQLIRQQFAVRYAYPVVFTRAAFAPDNPVLAEVVQGGGRAHNRALVVVDSEVARLTPALLEQVSRYADGSHGLLDFVAAPFIVRGGEVCKHEPVEVEQIQGLIERHRLCRHSFVIAIGGGAVLDAAGYAAATAHRGVRLVRLPTTVLAQNDAGVGVKNGINAFGRKNFLGTFAPPFAVINDFAFLETLPVRDRRAGIAEAIKVALIRDRAFFEFLFAHRASLAGFAPAVMERMIIRCAELHLQHIGQSGDPFESGSSRPLDFGHWSAHKLEELSGAQLRHGEAVAIGVALDALYSRHAGLLSDLDLHRILTLLEGVGFALYHPALAWLDVDTALSDFREHLGGELTIALLQDIGSKVEVNAIDSHLMKRCIGILAGRAANRGGESAGKGPARPAREISP